MKIIDMRFRPPYKDFQKDLGFNLKDVRERYQRRNTIVPPSIENLSMQECIKEMDDNGIERGVVPVRALRAEEDNDVLVELLQEYPQRFIGLAAVSMPAEQTEKALHIIDKYIINGPCAGLSLEEGLDSYPWYADDEKIFPVYEKCEENAIPVMILAGGLMHRQDAGDCDYYNPSHIEHVARHFPRLKIILAHGGWPWITQACYLAMNWDNVYLSPDGYLTDGVGGNFYAQAANNYALQDKIMFGSNFPGYALHEAITAYQNMGIKERVFSKVFYENAAKVFDIN